MLPPLEMAVDFDQRKISVKVKPQTLTNTVNIFVNISFWNTKITVLV